MIGAARLGAVPEARVPEAGTDAAGADPLGGLFALAGAVPVDVPLLQPAEPFLDAAGESLRRRIFLTRGERGETLCLRPEWTIPVCLAHIAEGEGLPRLYGYRGLVFRQRAEEPAEFEQAGIESFGETDVGEADARSIHLALEGLWRLGLDPARLDLLLGDQNLFEALLSALGLPLGWQRRLTRAFGDEARLAAALDALGAGGAAGAGTQDAALEALIEREDVRGLEALVARRMEEAGLPPFSGRSAAEVAERLVEKRRLQCTRLGADALEALRAFLSLDCPLSEAPARLRETAAGSGPALALFERRAEALASLGVDLAGVRYRAAFGRALDYYTGVVFEARGPGSALPLAGGGRYDRLMALLGARTPIPAVGFSLWLDRIAAERSR